MKPTGLLAALLAVASAMLHPAEVRAKEIRIATWNIAWLSNTPLPDRAAVARCEQERKAQPDASLRSPACQGNVFRMGGAYGALSVYARLLDADVVALQEIEGEEALRRVFDERQYVFRVADSPGRQRTAFAVRRAILAGPAQFREVREIGAAHRERPRHALEAVLPLLGGTELRLLNVHLKSFCHQVPLTTDTPDCRILAAQVGPLENWIDEAAQRGAPFLVLGDFNRVFDVEGPQARSAGRTVNMWPELDDNDPAGLKLKLLTRGLRHSSGCQHNTPAGKSPYFIDHVVAGGAALDRVPGNVVEHSYKILESDERAKRVPPRFLSDHCAISIQFQL